MLVDTAVFTTKEELQLDGYIDAFLGCRDVPGKRKRGQGGRS